MSLLEEAKKYSPKTTKKFTKINEETIELLEAYLKREVTGSQIAKVLGIESSNFPNWLRTMLTTLARQGKIRFLKG